jgi:hypothetical protein
LRGVLSILKESETKYASVIQVVSEQLSILTANTRVIFDVNDPDTLLSKLEELRKRSGKIVDELEGVTTALKIYRDHKDTNPEDKIVAEKSLDKLAPTVKLLSSFAERAQSVVGLYEIEFINGRIALRKVTLD